MPRITFNRKRVKLKQLLGIRARLALLALILVAPLMLERTRSLEDTRTEQIALAHAEFSNIAQHIADDQREVISTVEAMLKSAAYVQAATESAGHHCDIVLAGPSANLPWLRTLMIVGKDGRVQCSTHETRIGLDLSDRSVLKNARETHDFVFSDFLLAKTNNEPIMLAAYPVSAINDKSDSIIVVAVNLNWMSKIMNNLGGRPGILAFLVDSVGTVLAAPGEHASMIGRPLDSVPVLSTISAKVTNRDQAAGSFSFVAADDSKRTVNFARIASTESRLIVCIDEAEVSAGINREIRNAYLQLGFVCLFVLLGALIAAEKLIVQPIEMIATVAKRFGQGDWSARAARNRLPAEFIPLARSLNAMAAQLGQRERELVANNDRLTVMASIDMLSGLANRRGFQSRLDFEWMKAQQHDSELSLLMIDVDHFKLFNDTYGHPEGDACLTRIGETLAEIAVHTMGFAARYGGEEFCLLLPNADMQRALEIGETVRAAVQDLAVPHRGSSYETVTASIGVAAAKPNDTTRPSELIEAADAALYAAKHRGRNTVVEHGVAPTTDGAMALAS
jgi:diguanylate cyclase (GGDEF)-like protein